MLNKINGVRSKVCFPDFSLKFIRESLPEFALCAFICGDRKLGKEILRSLRGQKDFRTAITERRSLNG